MTSWIFHFWQPLIVPLIFFIWHFLLMPSSLLTEKKILADFAMAISPQIHHHNLLLCVINSVMFMLMPNFNSILCTKNMLFFLHLIFFSLHLFTAAFLIDALNALNTPKLTIPKLQLLLASYYDWGLHLLPTMITKKKCTGKESEIWKLSAKKNERECAEKMWSVKYKKNRFLWRHWHKLAKYSECFCELRCLSFPVLFSTIFSNTFWIVVFCMSSTRPKKLNGPRNTNSSLNRFMSTGFIFKTNTTTHTKKQPFPQLEIYRAKKHSAIFRIHSFILALRYRL